MSSTNRTASGAIGVAGDYFSPDYYNYPYAPNTPWNPPLVTNLNPGVFYDAERIKELEARVAKLESLGQRNLSTKFVAILDESASMAHLRDATVSSFNELIEDQRKLKGECDVLLVAFNTDNHVIQEDSLSKFEDLTTDDYKPSGGTALLDAIGSTIERVRLGDIEDDYDQIVVTIFTDGQENCSTKFTPRKIKQLIQKLSKKNWKFIFVGANQDAVLTGTTYGFNPLYTANYTSTTTGTRSAMHAVSSNVGMTRMGGTGFFKSDTIKENENA